MTNKKTAKRAFLMSLVALVLCFTMLLGTTYAWFTDSVTSGTNIIASGILDVGLYNDEVNVTEETELFDGVALWEPGAVAYENLTVKNEGNLALKYQLAINFTNENATTDGNYKLSDVLKVAVVKESLAKDLTREQVLAKVDDEAWKSLSAWYEIGSLLNNGDSQEYAVIIWWEPSANDNNWNLNNGKTTTDGSDYLHIDLGVMLVATQMTEETDSFDNSYDKDAFIATTTEADNLRALLAAAQPGDTVNYTLKSDTLVTARITVPEGVNLVLDGNGYTMGMDLGGAGFYAYRAGLTIKNLNIIGSAQCAIFTNGDRGIVDGKMVEYLVYPVLEDVTVDMESCSLAPLYFKGMGEATLKNCTITGDGQDSTYYSDGAHIFAGAEMKVVIDGGNIGNVFINANDESPESKFASGVTVKSGTVEKIVLESDWRTDKAGNANYTYEGGTVKEVIKVVDTGAELESALKEDGFSVALSGDVTLEGHLISTSMGDITIYGRGDTLSIRGIYGNNGANVTLNNLTLVDNNPVDYMIYNLGGKIELTKVIFEGNTNKAFQLAGGGDVVLTDCNISGEVTGTYSASNIWCGDGRNVTVNGGTYGSIFMNVSEGAGILSASKITVNDGTIVKLILETEKNTETGDGMGYKSATLVQNGGTITELVENPQNYDLTGLTKLN